MPPIGERAALVINAINELRVREGKPALVPHAKLVRAADDQAFRMAAHHKQSHNLGGRTAERVSSTGYRWRRLGENVACAPSGARTCFDLWSASEGHLRNILADDFAHLGVGVCRHYYCAIFAAPLG